jgi:hypothetical protein
VTITRLPNGAAYPDANEAMALTADRIRDVAVWADPIGPRGYTTQMGKDSAQNVPTGAWTSITWANQTYTPPGSNGIGGAGNNGTTLLYTALYRVTVGAQFSGNGVGRRGVGVCVIAGAPATTNNVLRPPLGATAGTPLVETFVLAMNKGDKITACAYQDSGATLTVAYARISLTLLALT